MAGSPPPVSQESVPQRDADLLHLWTVYVRAPAGTPKAKALAAFRVEVDRRATVDAAVRQAVGRLLGNATVVNAMQVSVVTVLVGARAEGMGCRHAMLAACGAQV